MKKFFVFFVLVFFLVLFDFLSKQIIKNNLPFFSHITIIDNFLDIVYVKNKGLAFGLLKNLQEKFRVIFLIYLPLIVVIILTFIILFSENISKIIFIGFVLIISGAVGNLIDRKFYGYVVDFIDLHYKKFHWPAFNFADFYISTGIILLFAEEFLKKIKRR